MSSNFYQQVVNHPDWNGGDYLPFIKNLIPTRLQAEYKLREIALFNEMFALASAEEQADLQGRFPPVTKERQEEARKLAETYREKLSQEEEDLRQLRRSGCSDARTLRRAHEDISTYSQLYDKYSRLAEVAPSS